MIENSIPFCFSWLFSISFARSALSLLSYQVIYYQSHSDLSLAYLSNSGLVLFLSCLGSFRYCLYSSLRFFVTPLFLIVVDQFWYAPILSRHWSSDIMAILIFCQATNPIPLIDIFPDFSTWGFFLLTKLLFSAIMSWGHRLDSASSWVIGLSVVAILCPWVYCYIAK